MNPKKFEGRPHFQLPLYCRINFFRYLCNAKVLQMGRMMSVVYAGIFCACIICGFVPPCRRLMPRHRLIWTLAAGKTKPLFCLTV